MRSCNFSGFVHFLSLGFLRLLSRFTSNKVYYYTEDEEIVC